MARGRRDPAGRGTGRRGRRARAVRPVRGGDRGRPLLPGIRAGARRPARRVRPAAGPPARRGERRSHRGVRGPAPARGGWSGGDEAALSPSRRARDGTRPPARARDHRRRRRAPATSGSASTRCPPCARPSRCTATSGSARSRPTAIIRCPGPCSSSAAWARAQESHENPDRPRRRLHEPGVPRQPRRHLSASRAGSTTARCSRSPPRTTCPTRPTSSAATANTRSAG